MIWALWYCLKVDAEAKTVLVHETVFTAGIGDMLEGDAVVLKVMFDCRADFGRPVPPCSSGLKLANVLWTSKWCKAVRLHCVASPLRSASQGQAACINDAEGRRAPTCQSSLS